MIVNSSVKTGFLNVKIEGMYFGLVSCSGIVKVTLWLAGSPVLESKMWVGMNLPQAMPYDEIQIESELDQPVEFWAGKAPMTQNISSFKGANALRATNVAVMGTAKLTSADFTRQTTRLRSNKDITIGGASFNGNGWKLKANTVEEFPVAGVLYGHRPIPDYDLSATEYTGRDENMWSAASDDSKTGTYYVSPDESTRIQLAKTTGIVHSWSVGGGWVVNPFFHAEMSVYSFQSRKAFLIESKVRGELYVIRRYDLASTRFYIVYKSTDFGLTFTRQSEIKHKTLAGYNETDNLGAPSYHNSTNESIIVGNILTMTLGFFVISYNLDTLEAKAWDVARDWGHDSGNGAKRGAWLDSECQRGVFILSIAYNEYYLHETLDGGTSWRNIARVDSPVNLSISEDGNEMLWPNTAGQVCYSVDSGSTYQTLAGRQFGQEMTQVLPKFWIAGDYTNLYAVYMVGDDAAYTVLNISPDMADSYAPVLVLPSGKVYRCPAFGGNKGYYGATYQLSISGDISPALVEVMELLN
jgi:hypothetical protein